MSSELIQSPSYWRRRLQQAPPDQLHHAIFKCGLDQWRRIEEKHREILSTVLRSSDSVLDCGCGWGRLLNLMPDWWQGDYLGVDLSPDFVHLARVERPGVEFAVGNLAEYPLTLEPQSFDWAVLISIRPMIKRHLGEEKWSEMERAVRQAARKLLYLEYDVNDGGSVE